MNGQDNMMEVEENDQMEEEQENQLTKYNKKIKQLHEKQQILKYSVAEHQDKNRLIYKQLYEKKKDLYDLVVKQFERKSINVDIATYEQFQSLRSMIQNQNKRLQQLNKEIDEQGLAGINNDQNLIKVKSKKKEMENQITLAKKFASTQYARDYLERPQIYRVAYEQVKYEYQMKIRLKESLEQEKQLYQKKKQQLNRALTSQNQMRQKLEGEKLQILNKM